MPTPIITDGTMDRLQEAPRVVLPTQVSELFTNRSSRLLALADRDPEQMGPYLRLMALVCKAQAKVIPNRPAAAVEAALLINSREHGMPPLADRIFNRDPSWREDLGELLATLTNESSLNSITSDAIHGLKTRLESDPNQVEALADAILTGAKLEDPLDAQLAPFVGAALQLHFTRIAQSLDPSDLQNSDVPGVCPCCGSRPTASLVHMEPDRVNSRYLVCSLCQTEWNMERVKCSSCYKEGGVAYMVIDNDPRATTAAAIRAETCDDCKTYLKIFIQEKDPMLDVMADDLASIKLDILVDENGYSRTGPNLLLYPGHD